MQRKHELDYMNAAGCLLVILIHVLSAGVAAPDRSGWQAAAIYLPWRFAGFAMPVFLYTAAVKMAGRYDGQAVTWEVYLRYVLNRIRKIFIPYVFWCAVYYIGYMCFGEVSGTLWEFLKYIVSGNLSASLYFVVIIMQFYLTMPLWVWLTGHVHAVQAAGIGLLVSLCAVQAGPVLAHFGITVRYMDRFFPTYCFFWIAGLYAGKHYDRLARALRERRTPVCCGAAVSVCCVLSCVVYQNGIVLADTFGIQLASHFLSILLLHAVCLRLKEGFLTGMLERIFRASFTVYLCHGLFLSILEILLADRGITHLGGTLLLRAAVCYTLPFLAYWLLAKLRGVPRRSFKDLNTKI